MTLAKAALLLALAGAPEATAQTALPPVATPDVVVIHNAATPLITVFAWERNGEFINAWPGDGKTPPYDAAKNEVKLFRFVTGDVRELHFTKGSRTHPHLSKEDIITYGVSARRVQITNAQSFQNEPGDASFQPNGVTHHAETLLSGVAIEIAFPGTHWANPEATWIPQSATPLLPVAAWTAKGVPAEAVGAAVRRAPPEAIRFSRRTFRLRPDYVLQELHLPKGARLPARRASTDVLAYVVSGQVRITVADYGDVALGGDAARLPSGQTYRLEALQDTVLVQAAAPADRPKAQLAPAG